MNIAFLDHWRKRHAVARRGGPADGCERLPESVAALLAECELLRARAAEAGLELDGSPASLAALDQLPPRWRDDPEELPGLGNDAGLYLGTLIVRSVPGAGWRRWPDGQPYVRLPSGHELDVVATGQDWAVTGASELYRVYAQTAAA